MDNSISKDRLLSPHLAIVIGGIAVRIIFWLLYPPIWKSYSVFIPLRGSALSYMAGFQSYHPLRMPFYDVAAAVFFLPTEGLLGIKAVTLFSLIVSCVGVVAFNLGARKLFSDRIGLYATVMFAFYPKFVIMTARGIPEAAAISIIGCMFYPLAIGFETGRSRYFLVSGVAALFAYLMYMPAVLVGIVTTLYLYVRHQNETTGFLPELKTAAFALPSFIVGVLYLIYGPLSVALSATTGSAIGFGSRPLFINSYGVIEKSVRYVGYTFIDFWWHQRGWDAENHIFERIGSIADLLGILFIPAAIFWISVVVMLTGLVFAGIAALYRQKTPETLWLFSWLIVFVILYNGKNIGWVGAFMTRQVSPILPAICIVFGVGAATLYDRYSGRLSNFQSSQGPFSVPKTLSVFFVCCLFLSLLAVGGVHGSFTASDASDTQNEIREVRQAVGPDDQIGVVDSYSYYRTVLYSNGELWPTVFLTPEELEQDTLYFSSLADIQSQEDMDRSGVRYVYILKKCDGFDSNQQALIDSAPAIEFEHEIQSTGCNTKSVLLDMDSDSTE
ncbi:ArnT family glycosyltransferase [Natronosalvus rutilus]|uniref:Glycosyltransferase family 39 protein n=1 Tax=Natronosalvus rutilus TaxID=2953753 RepID=A0A9E7SVZ4_9EURY|nr:glycosyltransferase family 39 protein [Natronosalvus rutilus]UTF52738.1 glycosyltransferase family 39 protein [Natronosalvus rutilus]